MMQGMEEDTDTHKTGECSDEEKVRSAYTLDFSDPDPRTPTTISVSGLSAYPQIPLKSSFSLATDH